MVRTKLNQFAVKETAVFFVVLCCVVLCCVVLCCVVLFLFWLYLYIEIKTKSVYGNPANYLLFFCVNCYQIQHLLHPLENRKSKGGACQWWDGFFQNLW